MLNSIAGRTSTLPRLGLSLVVILLLSSFALPAPRHRRLLASPST
ncbi:MAG TPA: hypothetical protein PKD53_03395 [Chloroflexaceae bacterium]|nr:hypothetical protein [Chloroflexaceae bacterium]